MKCKKKRQLKRETDLAKRIIDEYVVPFERVHGKITCLTTGFAQKMAEKAGVKLVDVEADERSDH